MACLGTPAKAVVLPSKATKRRTGPIGYVADEMGLRFKLCPFSGGC